MVGFMQELSMVEVDQVVGGKGGVSATGMHHAGPVVFLTPEGDSVDW